MIFRNVKLSKCSRFPPSFCSVPSRVFDGHDTREGGTAQHRRAVTGAAASQHHRPKGFRLLGGPGVLTCRRPVWRPGRQQRAWDREDLVSVKLLLHCLCSGPHSACSPQTAVLSPGVRRSPDPAQRGPPAPRSCPSWPPCPSILPIAAPLPHDLASQHPPPHDPAFPKVPPATLQCSPGTAEVASLRTRLWISPWFLAE